MWCDTMMQSSIFYIFVPALSSRTIVLHLPFLALVLQVPVVHYTNERSMLAQPKLICLQDPFLKQTVADLVINTENTNTESIPE